MDIKGVHCYRGPDRCPSGVFRKRQTTPATARDILQRQRCCFFSSLVLQIQPQIYPNYWSGISKPVGWFPYKMRSPRIAVVQALVFLTVQQWHMMRVHHSRIAGWLMKIPGFRLHSPRENPWRFDKPSPDPDHRTATRWRRRPTPWAVHRCAMGSTLRTKILAGAGMVCISTIAAWLYPWMCE